MPKAERQTKQQKYLNNVLISFYNNFGLDFLVFDFLFLGLQHIKRHKINDSCPSHQWMINNEMLTTRHCTQVTVVAFFEKFFLRFHKLKICWTWWFDWFKVGLTFLMNGIGNSWLLEANGHTVEFRKTGKEKERENEEKKAKITNRSKENRSRWI